MQNILDAVTQFRQSLHIVTHRQVLLCYVWTSNVSKWTGSLTVTMLTEWQNYCWQTAINKTIFCTGDAEFSSAAEWLQLQHRYFIPSHHIKKKSPIPPSPLHLRASRDPVEIFSHTMASILCDAMQPQDVFLLLLHLLLLSYRCSRFDGNLELRTNCDSELFGYT